MLKQNNLIIIASQPRSGSTLLQALLSNNDKVGTVSEPWLLLPFLGYTKKNLHNAVYNSNLAAKGIHQFKSKIGIENFDSALSNFLLSQYDKIRNQNETYVLDKTPRYYEILDEIIEYFPNCKIIILKRHPFSVLKSIIKTWHANDLDKLLEFKRDILNAPFLLHQFELKHTNNPNVKILKYEDLVENPKMYLKSLYDWLDIAFEESSLEYSSNKKYIGKLGDPTGVSQSDVPNKQSIDSWDDLILDKYWGGFLKGYLNFLTPLFLRDYGDYNASDKIEIKNNLKFDIFLEKSKWDFKEHSAPKFTMIKHSILRYFKQY